MKKALSLLLCLLLLLSLAACKKGGDPNAIFINTESTEENDNDVKDTVKVSFPKALIEEEYRDNLDAYCEKYGYKSAKLNSDGTVTIKMSAFSYELLLTKKGMDTVKMIYSVAENKKYSFVKGIKSYDDKNFAEISVLVNREKYQTAGNAQDLLLALAQSCYSYQAMAGRTFSCTVTVIDNKTKKAIETKDFTDSDIQTF